MPEVTNKYNVMVTGDMKTSIKASSLPDAIQRLQTKGVASHTITRIELSKPRPKSED